MKEQSLMNYETPRVEIFEIEPEELLTASKDPILDGGDF